MVQLYGFTVMTRSDAILRRFLSGLLVASLLVASGLIWAVMFFGPLAHLSRLAGGATPFDVRPMGYSYDQARAFLEAIGEQGRNYYVSRNLSLICFIRRFTPPRAGSRCGG